MRGQDAHSEGQEESGGRFSGLGEVREGLGGPSRGLGGVKKLTQRAWRVWEVSSVGLEGSASPLRRLGG